MSLAFWRVQAICKIHDGQFIAQRLRSDFHFSYWRLAPTPRRRKATKLEDLRVSFASFGVIYYPHFIARELGFYREEGLNVEMIAMPGGLATQALVAGDLHFSTSSGSSLKASLRGIKLKVVYVNLDRPLYRLCSWRDDIRKVTDLRGKGSVWHRAATPWKARQICCCANTAWIRCAT